MRPLNGGLRGEAFLLVRSEAKTMMVVVEKEEAKAEKRGQNGKSEERTKLERRKWHGQRNQD